MEQKKKALGKGLEQLFNEGSLDFETFETTIIDGAKESDIKEINLSEIRGNPYQPRKNFDQEALDELAASIRMYGVFQPIIVKKSIKGYDLVAGERRVRASKLAGRDTIPAIIKDFSDDEMREIALLENLQRENLTAVELAWAYKGIIDALHIRQEDLADKIGKSRSHVTNTLGLLRLPNDVQNMILSNQISMGHARTLSKMDDEEEIETLAKKIVNENLSVRDLETITSMPEIKKKIEIKRREVGEDYSKLEIELSDILGTRVKIKNKKLEVSFDSVNDLNRILEIMNIKID